MDSKYLRVAVVLIQLISTLAFEDSLPKCPGQAVVFLRSPQNVIVPCGSNMMAEFPCQYTFRGSNGTELPWWTIGSDPVGRSLPEYHYYDISTMTLRVRNISIIQNNTAYTCEFQTRENNSPCAYPSESGTIIITCEVTEIQYEPHYQYISTSKPATLRSIVTIITQNKHNHFINRPIFCSVIFYNSSSSSICHNDTFQVNFSNCDDRVCKHNLNILTSACPHNESINVSVWVIDPKYHDGVEFLLSNPTRIDAVNNFVNVSFNREKSIVNCSFIKQPLDSQKECSISVGPETPKCNDMVSYSQGGVDDTSNVSYVGFDIDLSFLSSHATKFCFIVNASTESGTRRVILSGIYDTASSLTIHHFPMTSTKVLIVASCGILSKIL